MLNITRPVFPFPFPNFIINLNLLPISAPAQGSALPPSADPILGDSHPLYTPESFPQQRQDIYNSLLDISL